MGGFEDFIDEIASMEHALLTEQQARAYVLREIQTVPRQQTAEIMDVSVNVVDNRLRAARKKVEAAERTIDILEEHDRELHPPVPDECEECGDRLLGPFITTDDGRALCVDCSDVDPSDVTF